MADDLKTFTVHGPFKVPLEPNTMGKAIAKDLTNFWNEVGDLQYRRGVYVFGIRASKGITPIYVGKAAKQTFKKEAFSKHKLGDHYNPALRRKRRCNPVMFFVEHPKVKGAVNKDLIDKIESFFIEVASTKNPELSNDRKKPVHKWRIRGLVRGKKGEATKSTRSFRKAVGLV